MKQEDGENSKSLQQQRTLSLLSLPANSKARGWARFCTQASPSAQEVRTWLLCFVPHDSALMAVRVAVIMGEHHDDRTVLRMTAFAPEFVNRQEEDGENELTACYQTRAG